MHFAALAYVGELNESPPTYYRNNVGGTATLLDAMQECGVAKIVFSSSCAVYGTPETVPISERSLTAPINPYGASKMICERMLRECAAAFPLTFIALRYFNAAGADPDGEIGECHVPETHAIPLLLDAAAGEGCFTIFGDDYPTADGTCVRDYIHVSDLADAHVAALRSLLDGEKARRSILAPAAAGRCANWSTACAKSPIASLPCRSVRAARRSTDPCRRRRPGARSDSSWRPRHADLETQVAHAWAWRQGRGEHGNGCRRVPRSIRRPSRLDMSAFPATLVYCSIYRTRSRRWCQTP